jgi:hypothetical protein
MAWQSAYALICVPHLFSFNGCNNVHLFPYLVVIRWQRSLVWLASTSPDNEEKYASYYYNLQPEISDSAEKTYTTLSKENLKIVC